MKLLTSKPGHQRTSLVQTKPNPRDKIYAFKIRPLDVKDVTKKR